MVRNATGSLYGIVPGTLAADKAIILDKNGELKGSLKHDTSDHFYIRTANDQKNIRMNSRNYTITSGEHTSVSSKPSVTVGGTTGITAFEASPRFQSGIAGGKLVGFFSNPDLKGAAGGNIGPMRCFEGKMESASGGSRTISVACTLEAIQSLYGTVTQGPTVILVNKGGGGMAWESVFEFKSTEGLVWNDDPATELNNPGGTVKGYIKVIVNDAVRYIALYEAGNLAD